MIEQKTTILLPPHEHLLTEFPSIYHVPAFIHRYFRCTSDPAYPMNVLAELRSTYHMSNDGKIPLVGLLERMWLMAAENGFPDVSEHKRNHYDRGQFKKKMTDPLHLVATSIYLAKRNTLTSEKKLEFIKNHPDLSKNEISKVWSLYWRRRSEEKNAVITYPIQDTPFYFDRLTPKYNIPLLLPDTKLHQTIAQFDFTSIDADHLSPREFKQNYFPQLKEAFKQICNLDEIIPD